MEEYNPFSLKGKNVLVTGASSGIGRAIAIEASKSGAEVTITGRDEERLSETFSLLYGKNNSICRADLTIEADLEKLLEILKPIDGLVHAAGIIKRYPLKVITRKSFEEVINVNLLAPANLTRLLFKARLLNKMSSIVFISSVGAELASIGNIMYMTSKGGMNSFMKGVALELASQQIRANAIEPGMIKTNLTKSIPDEELISDMKRYPLGRYGTPEEIAYAAIYLMSDASRWITGSVLKIDGGLSLH